MALNILCLLYETLFFSTSIIRWGTTTNSAVSAINSDDSTDSVELLK